MEVKVTPDRLKVIICLGCCEESTASSLEIEDMLGVPYGSLMDALEGLWSAGVVEALERDKYGLTEYGVSLFLAIYEATGVVLGGLNGQL